MARPVPLPPSPGPYRRPLGPYRTVAATTAPGLPPAAPAPAGALSALPVPGAPAGNPFLQGSMWANPLMYAGLGLLSQGPSLTPQSPWAGLASGLALGMQANTAQQAQKFEYLKFQQQLDKAEDQRQLEERKRQRRQQVAETAIRLAEQTGDATQVSLAQADPEGYLSARTEQTFRPAPEQWTDPEPVTIGGRTLLAQTNTQTGQVRTVGGGGVNITNVPQPTLREAGGATYALTPDPTAPSGFRETMVIPPQPTAEEAQAEAGAETVLSQLDQLDDLLRSEKVDTGATEALLQPIQARTGWGYTQQEAEADALSEGIIANVTRALFGGAASEGERAAVRSLVPTRADPPAVRQAKLSKLREQLRAKLATGRTLRGRASPTQAEPPRQAPSPGAAVIDWSGVPD